jgi:hypothetical protein
MARGRSGHNRAYEFGISSPNPSQTLAVLTAAAVVPLILLITLVPSALVLPVLSVVALMGATAIALWAWVSGARWQSDYVTRWDVAGAFAFIGFAAALLAEPEHVLQIMGPS